MHNTENKTEITAADVVAFLQSEAAKLATAVGSKYAFVIVEAGNPDDGLETKWGTYTAATTQHIYGETLDEALAKQIAAGAPEMRAAAKRAEAAKLLAEAHALAPHSGKELAEAGLS